MSLAPFLHVLQVQLIALLVVGLTAPMLLLDQVALLIAVLLDADLHSAALSPSLAQIKVAATFVFHPLPFVLPRSEEHTSELQSHLNLVCRLLLEKKKKITR